MNQREIDAILDDVNDAELQGGTIPDLAVGEHEVFLSSFEFKESKKDKSIYVDAKFIVDTSDVHEQGTLVRWAWFPQAKGWGKTYQTGFLKQFYQAMGECVGDTREPKEIGRDLSDKLQKGRGTRIKVRVKEQTDRAGVPKVKDGRTFVDAMWYPIAQELADIKQARAMLDELEGVSSEAEVEEPAQAPAALASTPAAPAKKPSLLARR